MIALFFALSLQAATPDIVISGRQLSEAYAACVEQGCPPLRDAQASIAFAEQQFRDGAYLKARHTLMRAISRNKRHAATDPKPVSALYEAYATVSLHDGDLDAFKSAVGEQVRTLRDNLPANDPAVVAAAFATGDMWLAMRKGRSARPVRPGLWPKPKPGRSRRIQSCATCCKLSGCAWRRGKRTMRRLTSWCVRSAATARPALSWSGRRLIDLRRWRLRKTKHASSTRAIRFPRDRPMSIQSNGSTSASGSDPTARRTNPKSSAARVRRVGRGTSSSRFLNDATPAFRAAALIGVFTVSNGSPCAVRTRFQ
jgi:hypothetical protein